MYEGHFGLNRRPFAATPDASCCYLSPTQSPSIQSVARCIEHGQGIAILTGPAGIGKTLLTQVLLADAEPRFTGAYLGTGQFPTRRALLQAILYELGQPYGGMTDQELRLELNTTLRNLITRQDGMLLVLDEAHLLSDRLLEEIRLLADLAQHGSPLTRVVLSGNPELEERLASPALAAFNQRVACHVVLETLTRPDSVSYLEHRIEWAGGHAAELFDRDALNLIADASDGLPRCLNQLADHSLMQAFLAGNSKVSAGLVRQTLSELQHLPLRWNPSALFDRSQPRSSMVTMTVTDEAVATPTPFEVLENADADDASSCSFEFGADTADSTFETNSPNVESAIATDSIGTAINADNLASEIAGTDIAESGSTVAFEDSPGQVNADGDEDDGPPLFAWLAKPTIGVVPPTDDYSKSSFKIPAKQRTRLQAVELEVVSMAPLSGADLKVKRRSDMSRESNSLPGTLGTKTHSLCDRLPAEEVVFDSYATLDSPQTPVFPRPPVCFPVVIVPTNRVTTSVDAAEGAPGEAIEATETCATAESAELTADHPQLSSASNPLERIDAICALLNEVDEHGQGSGGVELITDYGVERIDVDLPANAHCPAELSGTPQADLELEDFIGSTVVEIGRNVQQARATSRRAPVEQQRATRIDELLDSIERETQFDTVEPDPVEAISATRGAASGAERSNPIPDVRQPLEGGSGAVPPPNHGYKNFFSMLRRRQIR